MPKAATFIICVLVTISCKQPFIQPKVSLRDSAVHSYLTDIGEIADHDTLSEDFLMLRAYQRNDTPFLKNYCVRRNEAIDYVKGEHYKTYAVYPDSCLQLAKLNKSHYEEVYRFTYCQSFCPFKVIVTVARWNDSAQLQFVLYKPAGDARWDSTGCQVKRSFAKTLLFSQWEQVGEAIRYADFWNLKRDSESLGVDGSTLEVEGYLNERLKVTRSPRYHIVRRWLGGRPAIFTAFALAMKLSENKEGCITVN